MTKSPPFRSFEDALERCLKLRNHWSRQVHLDPSWAQYLGLLPYPDIEGPDRVAPNWADYLAPLPAWQRAGLVPQQVAPQLVVRRYWSAVDYYGKIELSPRQRSDLLRLLAETNASARMRCARCEKPKQPGEFDEKSTVCRACLGALGEQPQRRPRGRRSTTHGDDFIRVAAAIYDRATARRNMVRYRAQGPVRQPFSRYLCLVGVFLEPPARHPSNHDAYLHNARDVVARRRGAGRRWCEADGYVEIQITSSVALSGHSPGAALTLPAMDGLPVDTYWRRRLEEGAATIVREIKIPKVLREGDLR